MLALSHLSDGETEPHSARLLLGSRDERALRWAATYRAHIPAEPLAAGKRVHLCDFGAVTHPVVTLGARLGCLGSV